MLSGDAERFAQAQPVGFGELNLVVVEVGLVDDESDFFLLLRSIAAIFSSSEERPESPSITKRMSEAVAMAKSTWSSEATVSAAGVSMPL